jgi:hypothetical protein
MPRTRLRRRWGALLVPAALVLTPVALAGTAHASVVTTPARADATFPPSARKDLAAVFDPKLRTFGLRVTRAALVDATNHRDPHGTHLAIYVEPTRSYTAQDYVDGTVDVTRVFLPSVFSRWKGLRSFDVCQEPSPAVDDGPEPPPETQVFASRAGSRAIDWSTADLATLIARADGAAMSAGTTRPVVFSVYVAAHLRHTPAYRAAVGTTGSATSAPPTTPPYG